MEILQISIDGEEQAGFAVRGEVRLPRKDIITKVKS